MPSSKRLALRCPVSRLHLWLFALIGLAFAGCSKEAKQIRHSERADEFFASGAYDRAEIEYLNVLKANQKDSHALGRLGRIYFEQGKLGRAFPLLNGVKELDPQNLDNRVKLSQFLLAAGRRKEAIDEATFVLSQRPTDAEAILVLGEAPVAAEQITAARGVLAGLPADAKRSAAVLAALGFLAARENDATTAERYFNESLAADPKLPAAHTGVALLAFSKGDLRAVDAAFAKASEFSKPRARERLQYASFKLQIGDAANGKRLLEAITQETPDFLPALIRQIELAGNENRLTDADALLKSVRSQDPTNPEALLAATKLALVRGDSALAQTEAAKLIQLYPQFPPAYFEMARAHVAAAEVEKAIDNLNRALQLAPDYPDATVLLANLNFRRGNRSTAIVALRQLLAKRPTLTDAQLLLAEAYRAQGEGALALEIYERLTKAEPNNDRIALIKGLALMENRKPDEARAVFEAIYKRSPNSEAALEQLTGLDVATKQPQAARARLDAAIAAAPTNANLRIISAQLHFAVGQPSLGEQELRKAIELNPEQLVSYGLLARHLISAGSPEKALESLKTVVDRNPRDIGAWILAASIHEQRSDWTRAREAYEKAHAINPRLAAVNNNLAYLIGEHFGELDRALELAKIARELAPTNGNIADTYGWLLYKRGDYAQAQRVLREAADREAGSAEIRFHLGMAQYALGDETSATASFEAALGKDAQGTWAAEAKQRLKILKLTATATAEDRKQLEEHLSKQTGDVIAWSRLAEMQEKQGARDLALATREKVVQLNPQSARANLALARAYRGRGDRDKALAAVREARKLAPEDNEVALEFGQLNLESRDYATAVGVFQEVTRKAPGAAQGFYDLGTAALAVGRTDEARTAWRRAIELESLSAQAPATRERLTLLDAATTPTPAALALARKRLEATPDDLAALTVLARAATLAGDNAGAQAHLEKIVSAFPDHVPARRSLVLLLAPNPANDGRISELSAPLRDTLASDRELNRAVGLATHRLGDHRRAVTLLETTVRQSPDDAIAWFHLGLSQRELKQTDQARKSLQQSLDKGLAGDLLPQAQKALEILSK